MKIAKKYFFCGYHYITFSIICFYLLTEKIYGTSCIVASVENDNTRRCHFPFDSEANWQKLCLGLPAHVKISYHIKIYLSTIFLYYFQTNVIGFKLNVYNNKLTCSNTASKFCNNTTSVESIEKKFWFFFTFVLEFFVNWWTHSLRANQKRTTLCRQMSLAASYVYFSGPCPFHFTFLSFSWTTKNYARSNISQY